MKQVKARDTRLKSVDQLKSDVEALKKEQFNLRFQAASGQMENTSRVREVRRQIAQIKTILTEKSAAR
jgi:large subunit ribosomal protein L29